MLAFYLLVSLFAVILQARMPVGEKRRSGQVTILRSFYLGFIQRMGKRSHSAVKFERKLVEDATRFCLPAPLPVIPSALRYIDSLPDL